jgi:hypothetical protein
MNLAGGLALISALLLFSPPQVLLSADMTLPEGTRVYLQLNTPLSTRTSSEGDAFTAVVTEPVSIGEKIVIPKGSDVTGSVSRIQRPGRFKGKAVMTLQFQSISIPGRGQLTIVASLIGVDREGNRGVNDEGTIVGEGSEGRDAGRVIVPGLAGAGIGTLAGGGKGAGIGAGVGVSIGLASVFTSRGKDIEIRRGATLDISLDKPLVIPPETR